VCSATNVVLGAVTLPRGCTECLTLSAQLNVHFPSTIPPSPPRNSLRAGKSLAAFTQSYAICVAATTRHTIGARKRCPPSKKPTLAWSWRHSSSRTPLANPRPPSSVIAALPRPSRPSQIGGPFRQAYRPKFSHSAGIVGLLVYLLCLLMCVSC